MPFMGSLQEKEGKGQYEVPTYQHRLVLFTTSLNHQSLWKSFYYLQLIMRKQARRWQAVCPVSQPVLAQGPNPPGLGSAPQTCVWDVTKAGRLALELRQKWVS